MKTYELTYIISARTSAEELAHAIKNVETAIQEAQGVIISSHKGTAQALAYPIKKQSSGYYATVVFQAPETATRPLKAKLDMEKEVLRSALLIKKPAKEVKERRTRKPMEMAVATATPTNKKAEKLNEADLDKKLDEILG